jgi:epoxyqueuosine reductase
MIRNDDIKNEALSLGFTISGVALPARPQTYLAYERWLAAGRHSDMAYLATERARQRRAAPQVILPAVRSILALGIRYPNPTIAPDPPPGNTAGRVAAYAWGDDYHDVVPPRLEQLIQRLEKVSHHSIHWRGYTDTGPVLERDLSQQAGLGWIGKNTCLIDPQKGSYFLLAEALTDLDLEPDEPIVTDHCGTCTRCIDACPTNCILPDRTIDANRCISYLTIENKAETPSELRPKIGEWVFGCDVCQIVCPWNIRFAEPVNEPAFNPRPGIPRPILIEELELTPQAFNQKFKNSPVQRAKRRGYLRNVAVALGNARDPDTIPSLKKALQSEIEPLVRSHVAWALGQIRSRLAYAALEKARSTEPDPAVRNEIEHALNRQ